MRFAYADPPYPGKARKYYQREPTYKGEVDHAALIAQLEAGGYDGWALSTSADALQRVLALCPDGVRVCPWVKPGGIGGNNREGPQNKWEVLIVRGGRKAGPPCRDFLIAAPARHGGELPGRKPLAFCAFLFQMLGMQPGDELHDLFPGTGIVGRAWAELSRAAPEDASRPGSSDAFRAAQDDACTEAFDDASQEYSDDAFPRGSDDASARSQSDAAPFPEDLGDASPRYPGNALEEAFSDALPSSPGDALPAPQVCGYCGGPGGLESCLCPFLSRC